MTEPVILYGTQSSGETLPVQVDGTGRLVAEGLQGPKGDEGPQGPPGVGEIPPNPQPGQVLGWVNGELAWITLPPTPEPTPGLPMPLGPEGSVVQVVRGEAAWGYELPVPLPDLTWSNYLSTINPAGSFMSAYPRQQAFDGLTTTYARTNAGSQGIRFKPEVNLGQIDTIEVWAYSLGLGPYNVYVNGIMTPISGANAWTPLQNVAGQEWTVNTQLDLVRSGADNSIGLTGIKFNGTVLMDPGMEENRLRRNFEARIDALEQKIQAQG